MTALDAEERAQHYLVVAGQTLHPRQVSGHRVHLRLEAVDFVVAAAAAERNQVDVDVAVIDSAAAVVVTPRRFTVVIFHAVQSFRHRRRVVAFRRSIASPVVQRGVVDAAAFRTHEAELLAVWVGTDQDEAVHVVVETLAAWDGCHPNDVSAKLLIQSRYGLDVHRVIDAEALLTSVADDDRQLAVHTDRGQLQLTARWTRTITVGRR